MNFYDINEIKNDIYHLLQSIKDPEFPKTLGELNVINENDIEVSVQKQLKVQIYWTPTIKHCNFAFQIVLAMRAKLFKELLGYSQMKVQIFVKQGTHEKEKEINKQANDKERYRAALENKALIDFIEPLI